MQKKIIALAVAGLVSGAAFAQSNVTIYGIADASFESVKAGGATAANNDLGSRNRVTSNSSYIGFKGTEDLGGGMKAVFQIENGIYLDNAGTSAWANRDSYVGLAGNFGTVLAGNLTGPTRLVGALMDVNPGATGIGANTALLGKMGGGSGAGAFDQRVENAVAYVSPTWSGFHGAIGYTAGTTAAASAAVPLAPREVDVNKGVGAKGNTGWTIGLVYNQGPILAAYTWTALSATNGGATAGDGIAAGVSKAVSNRAAFKYDFGMATAGLMWDQIKYNGANIHRNAWFLPVTAKLGPGTVVAQYGSAGNVTNTSNTGAKMFEVGYNYDLSKRTMIKAYWAKITNNSAATYDFLLGNGANANSTAYKTSSISAGADPTGFGVGLRHAF